jgi:hypothetical protein
VRLILRGLRMGVRRVYGLLDPSLRGVNVGGGGRRGYGLRVLEYRQRTFLGTSLSALLLFFCCSLNYNDN